ncbi:hypothetical protein ACFH04_02575 [Streptomyces noboritoensis]|uniref:Uncharacterized protein n=1 Tax=Streptomyces noboritoensis TaxID=67337 RepID=A0ABV6TA01_9ACTN
MLFEKKTSPIVVRDGHDILAAVRTALAQAVPGEQAGLERAVEIIEAHCRSTDDDLLGRWVRGILAEAGVDSRSDHVQRVITLRKAVPELTLTAAHRLVVNAVGE